MNLHQLKTVVFEAIDDEEELLTVSCVLIHMCSFNNVLYTHRHMWHRLEPDVHYCLAPKSI